MTGGPTKGGQASRKVTTDGANGYGGAGPTAERRAEKSKTGYKWKERARGGTERSGRAAAEGGRGRGGDQAGDTGAGNGDPAGGELGRREHEAGRTRRAASTGSGEVRTRVPATRPGAPTPPWTVDKGGTRDDSDEPRRARRTGRPGAGAAGGADVAVKSHRVAGRRDTQRQRRPPRKRRASRAAGATGDGRTNRRKAAGEGGHGGARDSAESGGRGGGGKQQARDSGQNATTSAHEHR